MTNPPPGDPISTSENADDERLFDQVGGAVAIAKVVDDMYFRVLQDPQLAPFFEGTHIERLRRMQTHFLASAFDGPVNYTGSELTAVHKGLGVTSHQFALFCGHFADAMLAAGIDPAVTDRCLARLATFKGSITGEVGVDG